VLRLGVVLSPLLAAGAAVLWVRAQVAMDRVVINSTRNYVELNGRRGGLWVLWIREPRGGRLWVSFDHQGLPPHPLIVRPQRTWHHFGFLFHRATRGVGNPGSTHLWITVPFWFIAACASAPSVAFLGRATARARSRPGHCRGCGYDLRASPGRCPECGERAPSPTLPAAPVAPP
jgi:hypothetical protein